jgi:hypothetical protein
VNYSTLFETIKGYVENDFPNTQFTASDGSSSATLTSTEQINTFIQQAEQRIYNSVQFPAIRKNVTAALTPINQYLSTPSDFLAVYSLAVLNQNGEYNYLLNKDVNFIRQAYPSPSYTGIPEYYAIFGPTTTNSVPAIITNEYSLILGPTPDSNYTVELHYYYYPESIVTASTTWLGDNFDSILLYGSLLEAYTYMKGEADVIANYQKRYDEGMVLAKRLGDGMERGDAYRDGQIKSGVT